MLLRAAIERDRARVLALLEGAALPTEGVAEHFGTFVIAESASSIVGTAGLEIRGADALLRSVVVAPQARGTGLGSRLTLHVLGEARARGAEVVYLLTTTAEAFFPRFGFERIGRNRVPASVQESREFRGACPASAVAMRLRLEGAVLAESAR
jgi:amino-acid N-acetyltransferase